MITYIFRNENDSIRAEIKSDGHASLDDLQTAGFDERFTAMTVEADDTTIAMGIAFREREYSFQEVKKIAQDNELELIATDLNDGENGRSETIVTF